MLIFAEIWKRQGNEEVEKMCEERKGRWAHFLNNPSSAFMRHVPSRRRRSWTQFPIFLKVVFEPLPTLFVHVSDESNRFTVSIRRKHFFHRKTRLRYFPL